MILGLVREVMKFSEREYSKVFLSETLSNIIVFPPSYFNLLDPELLDVIGTFASSCRLTIAHFPL